MQLIITNSLPANLSIAGQILNGKLQFIQCDADLSNRVISSNNPFTISFLVQPKSFGSRTIFFAGGRSTERPVILFEKSG